jgi:hypothetical protein
MRAECAATLDACRSSLNTGYSLQSAHPIGNHFYSISGKMISTPTFEHLRNIEFRHPVQRCVFRPIEDRDLINCGGFKLEPILASE